MISEKEYWSQKFKLREDKLMEPELFIKNNVHFMRIGTVLDIACGDGRNAIYLAKRGFEVTGVDFSDEAIKRLSKFSEENNVSINKKILDLSNLNEINNLGKFSNIIISHYKPTTELFHTLPNLLDKDGILILCTFNYRQHEERGFQMKYCLEKDEFLNVSDELLLIKHEVIDEERGHLDGYVYKLK